MRHAAPPKHSAALTALTAFLIAFAVFGAMLFAPLLIDGQTTDPPLEADGLPSYVWQIGLFFREGDTLTGVVRLTVDTQTMHLHATGYPPSTELGGKSLQRHMDDSDMTQVFSALCEEAGCASDGVLGLSVSNTAAFIVYLKERLVLDLPEPMDILSAGEGTLTAMQVADALRYTAWSGGEAVSAQLHAQTVAAIFNRYLRPDRNFETDFKKLTTLCDDPPSISQYAKAKDVLRALAEHNDGLICTWT